MRGILIRLLRALMHCWRRGTQQSPATPPIKRRERKPDAVATPFCGLPHRLKDGLPLSHHCHVLPPEALIEELRGNHSIAVLLLARVASRGPLPRHGGYWKLRR